MINTSKRIQRPPRNPGIAGAVVSPIIEIVWNPRLAARNQGRTIAMERRALFGAFGEETGFFHKALVTKFFF